MSLRLLAILVRLCLGLLLSYATLSLVVSLVQTLQFQEAMVVFGILLGGLWWLCSKLPDWSRKPFVRSGRNAGGVVMTTRGTESKGRMSGFVNTLKPAPIERLWPASLGQSYPQRCPTPEAGGSAQSALGEPLSIKEAAAMMGCSAWTIRQRYIPQGLPHLRSGPAGKLIFYRHQIVRWILQQQTKQQTKQQKGGRYS